jgi:hypothetical protein
MTIQQVDPVTGRIYSVDTATGMTDFGSSNQFQSANSKTFQSSDLNQPSSDTWQGLSDQMQPSQGAGSGNIDQQSHINNDAQWIRAFSLIVYSHGVTGGGTVPIQLPAQAQPKSGVVVPFRPRGTPRDSAASSTATSGSAPDSSGGKQLPGLDLSNLRCTFSIQKTTLQTPNMLYARIYNLAPETMAKVISFTRIQVHAGYKYASYGAIYDGEVIQYRRGKENPVDTYLEIHAADGDTINNGTMLFKAYPAGTKKRQVLDDLNAKKKQLDPNFKVDQIDSGLYTAQFQRGTVVVGHSKVIERRMFLSSGAQHFIDNGAFLAITEDHYRDGEVVVLSPNTGLVGLPEVTPQGIQAKCLLNPKLKLGGLVKIDTNILSGVAYTPGTATKTDANGQVIPGDTSGGKIFNTNEWRQQMETAYTSPIGQYKILLMTYTGDTRGNPWYCDITCIAMDSNGHVIKGNNASSAWKRASQLAKGDTGVV